MSTATNILLRLVSVRETVRFPDRFPYNVPVIRSLQTLVFTSQVTFLVGENGSGKSILLEAIAAAAGSITMGSEAIHHDRSLDAIHPLADGLKLVWSKKTSRGFFMRAEDFFGYVRKMNVVREGLEKDLEQVEKDYADRSETARGLARMAFASELHAMRMDYDNGLDARSHGESYLRFFKARFVPEGLYLLDEPEAPLSPLRQLSFLVLLKSMVEQKAQFLIATHSPILMAFPGATLLNFEAGKIERVRYEDLEHVRITRAFLAHPEQYLKHLFAE
jgi:predicted ATPase